MVSNGVFDACAQNVLELPKDRVSRCNREYRTSEALSPEYTEVAILTGKLSSLPQIDPGRHSFPPPSRYADLQQSSADK